VTAKFGIVSAKGDSRADLSGARSSVILRVPQSSPRGTPSSTVRRLPRLRCCTSVTASGRCPRRSRPGQVAP